MQHAPPATVDRVPGAPHPWATAGRNPDRARRQSLLLSVLAWITLLWPPLPFLFGGWAIARAADAGPTGRPAAGHVLGAVAIVLSAVSLALLMYLLPALFRLLLTHDASFDFWRWWQ